MGINIKNNLKKSGYTIVEMVIVIGVLSIIIPSIFAILLANLRAQSKVHILQEVKSNGDNALATIETLIKINGKSLHSSTPVTDINKVCLTADYSGAIYIQDKGGNWFRFYEQDGRIASESASGTTFLTNDNVDITNFSLICEARGEINSPIISISYDISQATETDRVEEEANLSYQTKIKLRYYE